MNNIKTWKQGEFIAQKYLKSIGYKILETNSKLCGAEVDIVAIIPKKLSVKKLKEAYKSGSLDKKAFFAAKDMQEDILAIIEVKARTSENFGSPKEAVDKSKQSHIRRFAQTYIKKNCLQNMPIQFDVVSIVDEKIEHIENAF